MKPQFVTSIISSLCTAIFFVILLHYWLRTVEKVKDNPLEDVRMKTATKV